MSLLLFSSPSFWHIKVRRWLKDVFYLIAQKGALIWTGIEQSAWSKQKAFGRALCRLVLNSHLMGRLFSFQKNKAVHIMWLSQHGRLSSQRSWLHRLGLNHFVVSVALKEGRRGHLSGIWCKSELLSVVKTRCPSWEWWLRNPCFATDIRGALEKKGILT